MSSTKLTLLLMLTLLVKESALQCPLTKPNIVVIIADDVVSTGDKSKSLT
jgi:hypothetical protein